MANEINVTPDAPASSGTVTTTTSGVRFSKESILGSPFFWIMIGAAAIFLIQYQTAKKSTPRPTSL